MALPNASFSPIIVDYTDKSNKPHNNIKAALLYTGSPGNFILIFENTTLN